MLVPGIFLKLCNNLLKIYLIRGIYVSIDTSMKTNFVTIHTRGKALPEKKHYIYIL